LFLIFSLETRNKKDSPMPCIVCRYNQVKEVDRALLAGVSPTALSKKYTSFSASVLKRHQEHLMQKMAQADQRFHASLDQWLFCKLNLVMEMVLGVVRGAKTGGDFKLFLQATREFTRIVSLMHKMNVRLDPEFIYCLMATPQWDLQEEGLLPVAFQALAKTRQSLKVNLYAPCPEPEPEPNPDQAPHPLLGTTNPEPATPTASQCPNPCPGVSLSLTPPKGNGPETGSQIPTAADRQATNQRDDSATPARNERAKSRF
jgi:hypothetical protein